MLHQDYLVAPKGFHEPGISSQILSFHPHTGTAAMHLFKLMRLVWVALIREGASQVLPPRTLVAAEPGTEPWRSDRELRRRQDSESLEDLISGTLTLTIAPDETCGYYGNGPTYYSCVRGACT